MKIIIRIVIAIVVVALLIFLLFFCLNRRNAFEQKNIDTPALDSEIIDNDFNNTNTSVSNSNEFEGVDLSNSGDANSSDNSNEKSTNEATTDEVMVVKSSDNFKIITVTDSYSGEKFAHKLSYPAIDGSGDGILFNIYSDIKSIATEWLNTNIKLFNDEDYSDGLELTIVKTFENDKVISFVETREGSAGGTSWTEVTGISYNKVTGYKLNANELLAEGASINDLVVALKNAASSTFTQEELLEDWESNATWEGDLPSITYTFSDEGLVCHFSKYGITYGFVGAPSVTIPYDKLDGIVSSKYLFNK